MRVLLINKFFHPRAGAETSFLQTRRLLQDNGDGVIDFAMRHPSNLDSPYASYFAPQRSYEREASPARRVADAVASIYSWPARRALARLLDAHRPDVAHLHNVYHQLTLSLLDELAVRRIPVVLTMHDWKIACPAYTLFTEGAPCRRCPGGSPLHAVAHRCVKGSRAASALAAAEAAIVRRRALYGTVHRFVAPSRFAVSVAEMAGVEPVRIVHVPNFLSAEELEAPAPAGDDGPRFVYAGRLDETKGIRPMLMAFAAVQAPASLRIAGSGKLEGEVRAAAARDPRVAYLGRLERDELYGELDRARAVLLPSLYEDNGPLSILEAQARGKPMIVTDRGGPSEFVRDGETGLVVSAGDVSALAGAMTRMATDGERAREWGARAQIQVRREHSPARHYERLSAVYREAVAAV
jgi:glycosyltransferase involved in cell wall biosynthesis